MASTLPKAVKRLLGNLIHQALDKEYYMELKDSIFKFSKVTAKQLMTHILTNYAMVDDEMIQNNQDTSDAAPDLSMPIDMYFKKQERCRQISIDGGIEIYDVNMVQKMQLHVGKTGLISSKYKKWCAKLVDKTYLGEQQETLPQGTTRRDENQQTHSCRSQPQCEHCNTRIRP